MRSQETVREATTAAPLCPQRYADVRSSLGHCSATPAGHAPRSSSVVRERVVVDLRARDGGICTGMLLLCWSQVVLNNCDVSANKPDRSVRLELPNGTKRCVVAAERVGQFGDLFG